MKYDSPKLHTLLAAEYVLGTLRGRARQRYERLRVSLSALQREQTYWETRLAVLGLKLEPKIPPEELWARIEVLTRTPPPRSSAPPATHASTPLLDRTGFWQGVALAAALAAITMGVLLRQVPVPAVPGSDSSYVSIVQASEGAGLWMVTADVRGGVLRCKAVGSAYPIPPGKDLELWLLVKDEAAPISLGLMPMQGEMTMPLDSEMALKLARAKALAVSLEPTGGSATGAPTGPVLFTAPLVQT